MIESERVPAGGQKKPVYPPTYRVEVGQSIVAIAIDVRVNQVTKYGPRNIVHMVLPQEPERVYTLFLRPELGIPVRLMPFGYQRRAKGDDRLVIPETEDEARSLVEHGMPQPAARDGQAPIPESVHRWIGAKK